MRQRMRALSDIWFLCIFLILFLWVLHVFKPRVAGLCDVVFSESYVVEDRWTRL